MSRTKSISADGLMTDDLLVQVCKERDDLYTTPELNEKLFLQYMQFKEIKVKETYNI